MSIAISNQTQPSVATQANQAAALSAKDSGGQVTARLSSVDISVSTKVSLGTRVDAPATYGDPRIRQANASASPPSTAPTTAADLDAILAESESKAQQIMNLILPLVEQQSLNLGKVVSGEQKLNADPATIASAKAAIADDGEFGVQQVADRILSFAKMAMGDDPARLATFRAAVEDGFKQAADMLGGTLPEISEKTRSTIMATFDQWEKDGFAPVTQNPDAAVKN